MFPHLTPSVAAGPSRSQPCIDALTVVLESFVSRVEVAFGQWASKKHPRLPVPHLFNQILNLTRPLQTLPTLWILQPHSLIYQIVRMIPPYL